MNFEESMLIPTAWQFLLASCGLVVLIAQYRASLRSLRQSTLPPWAAKPGHMIIFFGVAALCFLGSPLLCNQLARLLFPQIDFSKNFLFLVLPMQATALLFLVVAVKYLPEAFPPKFNAPQEKQDKQCFSPSNLFGVPAFFTLGIFAVVAGCLFVQGVVSFFPEDIQALFQEKQILVESLNASDNKILSILCVPAIVVFTPIIEELFFRAGLYRFLKSKMPPLAAAIVSSGIFALMHDSYASYLPLTFFGCVLCFAYEKTGRIAAPIFIHALFNANTLLCLALMEI